MPSRDFRSREFTKPVSLKDALQRFSLELNCVMVRLRDEANFNDQSDRAALDAAHLFLDVLDDTRREAEILTKQIEQRADG